MEHLNFCDKLSTNFPFFPPCQATFLHTTARFSAVFLISHQFHSTHKQNWWTRRKERSKNPTKKSINARDLRGERDEGDWFIADVLALKRDIPLVQRFNHLIVKYVSTSPFRGRENGKCERRRHEHTKVSFRMCIDYSFARLWQRLNTQKLSSTKSKNAIIIKIYMIIYDFSSLLSHGDTI